MGEVLEYASKALESLGRKQKPKGQGKFDTYVPSAGEQGPDIASIAKKIAGGFEISAPKEMRTMSLGRIEAVPVPKIKPMEQMAGASGFKEIDVQAYKDYDRVYRLDNDQQVEEATKARAWRELAARYPQFRERAMKRAEEWEDVYATRLINEAVTFEKGRRHPLLKQKKWQETVSLLKTVPRYRDTAEKRASEWMMVVRSIKALEPYRKKDWEKLSQLLELQVIPEGQKRAWAKAFVDAYGKDLFENPHLPWLLAWLPKDYVDPRGSGEGGRIEASDLGLEYQNMKPRPSLLPETKTVTKRKRGWCVGCSLGYILGGTFFASGLAANIVIGVVGGGDTVILNQIFAYTMTLPGGVALLVTGIYDAVRGERYQVEETDWNAKKENTKRLARWEEELRKAREYNDKIDSLLKQANSLLEQHGYVSR